MIVVMDGMNQKAADLCQTLVNDAELLGIKITHNAAGTRIIDCGTQAPGGLEAGRRLAEICLGGLGHVHLHYGSDTGSWPNVTITSDHPVAACMASQYAGWQLKSDDYFAMGSGPFRAATGREKLFETIGMREKNVTHAVGVLETAKLPPAELCVDVAAACQVPPDQLTLLVARTASHAGNLQIVARSVETALHKMHELGFDMLQISNAMGTCPLPPLAADDMTGIGRTNDAVLYASQVTLWLHSSDEAIQSLGPNIPSCASQDFGEPFIEIFERYEHDFYRIDPNLFSPAQITLISLESGNCFRFGKVRTDIAQKSFSNPK